MSGWAGVQYTSPYWTQPGAGGQRTGHGLQYTAPHAGVTSAPLAERRPAGDGAACAPYAARLSGLAPRTVADWSAFVSGCATIYRIPISDGRGGRELFHPTTFAADHNLEVPILFHHDYERHIGWCKLEQRTDGLYFTGQLRRGMARAIGGWRGISLGFCSISPHTPGRVRKHYTAQALEVSVCERGAHHPHSYMQVLDEAALAA